MQHQNNHGGLYFNNINMQRAKLSQTFNVLHLYKAWQYINLGVSVWPLLIQHFYNKRILPQKCLAQVISRHEDCVCEKEVIQESFCRGRQKSPRYNILLRGRREDLLLLVCMEGIGPSPPPKKGSKHIEYIRLSFNQLTICHRCRDQMLYLTSTSSVLKEPTSTNIHNISHSSQISKSVLIVNTTILVGSAACKATFLPAKLFWKFRSKALSNRREKTVIMYYVLIMWLSIMINIYAQ